MRGRMCKQRHTIKGEKFTDWLVHPKGRVVVGMRSLGVPLDLGGISSTDRTGPVCLDETKK